MKKAITGLFLLCLFLCCQTVFAGTCGTNVKYTVKDNTLTYTKKDPDLDAVWDYNCTDAYVNNITEVKIEKKISVKKAYRLFEGFKYVEKMNLVKLDVSGATDMRRMFYDLRYLQSLNVSGWDTSKVTDMSDMFYHCSSLKTLDLSSWNVSRVTGMERMFAECSVLSNLNLSVWNTGCAEKMDKMFYKCSALPWLDLSGWDTTRVTDNPAVFTGCDKLQTLVLGKNTLKNNIFAALPGYGSVWYYIMAGPEAGSPLGLNTEKSNGELFTGYAYNTMAGIWSMNDKTVPAKSVRIMNVNGTDITGKSLEWKALNYQLKAAAQPAGAVSAVTWKSSNTAIATVSANGMVTFKKGGTVTITASTVGSGLTAAVTLKFVVPKMTAMTILSPDGESVNGTTQKGNVGKSYTYTITPKPEAASNAVTWKSFNTGAASITTAGTVTCKAAGSSKITATAKDGSGVSASFTIKCVVPKMRSMSILTPAGIKVNGTTQKGYVGNVYIYAIKQKPLGASKAVTWKSSKTGIAAVAANGTLTCKAAGSSVITATAKDGTKVSAKFTIKCVKK